MPLPRPYQEADDVALVDACAREDPDAFAMLEERYGALVETTIRGEVGAATGAEDVDPDDLVRAFGEHIRRSQAAALRAWSESGCQLRSYLAVIARQATARRLARTRRRSLVASLPTPSALTLHDVRTAEHSVRVHDVLDRLPPNAAMLVRLRVRGIDRATMSAIVGVPVSSVTSTLERVAARIGDGEEEVAAWRAVLGVSDARERVTLALRTEDDEAFRAQRGRAESTWRAVRERVTSKPPPMTGLCLDEVAIGGLVDGTTRGAARARAEGHVATCARCVDEVAALSTDLRAMPVLREAGELARDVAVAGASVALTRFDVGSALAAGAASVDVRSLRAAHDVARLARAGSLLEGGRPRAQREASGLVAREIPSDDEAPLVAFEALVAGDTHGAFRAIDEPVARTKLGARLRMLAAAMGEDLPLAAKAAETELARAHRDPGACEDAACVLALPEGRRLPRETLVERLRDVLPEAVRNSIARAARASSD